MGAPLSISFQGAARTVTGSRHKIQFGDRTWLFDCGLYQGHREEADAINRQFAFDPASLDAVIVSHAHLDHIGNLPTLVAGGFDGPIHGTEATFDLARPMLADSAFLQERDLDRINRRHPDKPRTPLYTTQDVERTVPMFVSHRYYQSWSPFEGVQVDYYDAGHILGSALTTFEFSHNGRSHRLGMSGDLGRPDRPILRDPDIHPGVDTLVMESTYGDRLHSPGDQTEHGLVEIVKRTIGRGGRVLVPAFAVGRAQELVAKLHDLFTRGVLSELPVFVDSPLAREATGVFTRHPELFDEPTKRLFHAGSGAPFGFDRLRYIRTPDESRALNDFEDPCIIIAASGMCEGGRILHHLRHGLPDVRNTVLFVGFQAEGTLGRRLTDGATVVNVYGEPVDVRAEIMSLDGFSAHADQHELSDWVARLNPMPKNIFLVHGEPAPAETLAGVLRTRFPGVTVQVPEKGEAFDLWT
jgi:metallo-beta-lactamase family protein